MFWINELRFIAAFSVIVLHVSASYLHSAGGTGSSLLVINFYESIVRWCVPVFVIITGFLLYSNATTNLASFYRKRVKRILLPLLFWSVFYLIWIVAKNVMLERDNDILNVVISILEGRPYYHLWYLYMIIGIYLFSPIMNLVIKNLPAKHSLNFISIMFLLAFSSVLHSVFMEQKSEVFLLMFIKFVPFYMFGALLKKYDSFRFEYSKLFITLFLSVIGVFISFLLLNIIWGMEIAFIAYNYNNLLVVLMSLSLFIIFKQRVNPFFNGTLFDFGSTRALGIYLIHPVFLDVFNYLGAFESDFLILIAIPLLSLLTFGLALFGCSLLIKLPWFNKVV